MREKMSSSFKLNNSVKLNFDKCSIESNVKFAGEEAKDRLYEPKHKKKLVRVLTVVAYLFLVSLAAIMLSLYYVFLWNGGNSTHQHHYRSGGGNRIHDGTFQKCLNEAVNGVSVNAAQVMSAETSLELKARENATRLDDANLAQGSPFFEKILQLPRLDY